MKRLDELGVSPAPWKSSVGIDVCRPCICDANGRFMLEYTDMENRDANARLIAAAPDLYEALREAVEESCIRCGCQEPEVCANCHVVLWRKALEKAARTTLVPKRTGV